MALLLPSLLIGMEEFELQISKRDWTNKPLCTFSLQNQYGERSLNFRLIGYN